MLYGSVSVMNMRCVRNGGRDLFRPVPASTPWIEKAKGDEAQSTWAVGLSVEEASKSLVTV